MGVFLWFGSSVSGRDVIGRLLHLVSQYHVHSQHLQSHRLPISTRAADDDLIRSFSNVELHHLIHNRQAALT